MSKPTLSADERRQVCVHEAAHAVVHSLGGAFVYGLEVASAGATDWQTKSRKGTALTDVWGVCHVSDAPVVGCLRWDDANGAIVGDRELWKTYQRALAGQRNGRALVAESRRQLRAWSAGALAGPVADAIAEGKEPYIEPMWGVEDDAAVAEALTWLLPLRNELESLTAQVHTALRMAEIWSAVQRIAMLLEQHGALTDVDLQGLLPAARSAWPTAPRPRSR